MIGVAGKPTTTTPMFRFSISRPNALQEKAMRNVESDTEEAETEQQHKGLSTLNHTGLW